MSKTLKLLVAAAAVFCLVALVRHYYARRLNLPPSSQYMNKLKSAKHLESSFPAQKQTIDLAKNSSLKHAALNAIGMEIREVSSMASGSPESTFLMLSHLGGFGQIVWVQSDWTNFQIKLPPTSIPGQVAVPRRAAVQAALEGIEVAGGCLIEAGPHRYLVAKVSEKPQYEAAIRGLGWLEGTPPPWEQTNANANADPGHPATGNAPEGQPGNSPGPGRRGRPPTPAETNRTPPAAGFGG